MINSHKDSVVPLCIIGGLFFMFGFVTWLNGSLIPFLQIVCELNHLQAYFVTLAFYISYTIMALPMSLILRRTGYKNGMGFGLMIMVIGALLFIPAAFLRMYSIFLCALFVLGTGLTILQTASNPYIVMIGPRETAAVRISIMGVLNKSAGVIAPFVFTALALSDMSQFTETRMASLNTEQRAAALTVLSSRLIWPYLLMAGMLIGLAVFVKYSPLPEPVFEDNETREENSKDNILQYPRLVLGAVTLFFYVGAEVIAGDTIGLFGKTLGVTNFGELTAYTMAFMVTGYIVGMLAIPRLINQEKALALSALIGIICCVLVLASDTNSSDIWPLLFGWINVPAVPNVVFYVALFGLANAMVWPAVWPLAIHGLNQRHTSTGSALLIMGIAGGAMLPLVYGASVEIFQDSQSAYWIMIPCYIFILFYAVIGHKMEHWPLHN